jgi:hypothetical protein
MDQGTAGRVLSYVRRTRGFLLPHHTARPTCRRRGANKRRRLKFGRRYWRRPRSRPRLYRGKEPDLTTKLQRGGRVRNICPLRLRDKSSHDRPILGGCGGRDCALIYGILKKSPISDRNTDRWGGTMNPAESLDRKLTINRLAPISCAIPPSGYVPLDRPVLWAGLTFWGAR